MNMSMSVSMSMSELATPLKNFFFNELKTVIDATGSLSPKNEDFTIFSTDDKMLALNILMQNRPEISYHLVGVNKELTIAGIDNHSGYKQGMPEISILTYIFAVMEFHRSIFEKNTKFTYVRTDQGKTYTAELSTRFQCHHGRKISFNPNNPNREKQILISIDCKYEKSMIPNPFKSSIVTSSITFKSDSKLALIGEKQFGFGAELNCVLTLTHDVSEFVNRDTFAPKKKNAFKLYFKSHAAITVWARLGLGLGLTDRQAKIEYYENFYNIHDSSTGFNLLQDIFLESLGATSWREVSYVNTFWDHWYSSKRSKRSWWDSDKPYIPFFDTKELPTSVQAMGAARKGLPPKTEDIRKPTKL
jgi:hypothetical protein